MTPHDDIAIKAEKFKEELWAYIEEFEPKNSSQAKDALNLCLDLIDSFVDEDCYK